MNPVRCRRSVWCKAPVVEFECPECGWKRIQKVIPEATDEPLLYAIAVDEAGGYWKFFSM